MNRRTRKILAFLLCFSMILNICPKFPVQASGNISVMNNGSAVESVVLPQNERVSLTADRSKLGDGEYQWQILAFGSVWVDIAGAYSEELELSYAMVANLLDDNEATLRCKVANGENINYSTEVDVIVDYDVEPEASSSFEIIIEEEGEVIISEVSGNDKSTENESKEEIATDSDAKLATDSDADLATDSNSKNNGSKESENSGLIPRMFRMLRSVAPETKTEYNIVINYLFENNTVAADSYTATIGIGTSFNATVKFPSIMGYLPYHNDIQKNQIDLSLGENQKEDVIINVVYKPTNVDYTVIHYQQNVDNDNYTEVKRETKQGLTNSVVNAVENSYDGFYSLIYEKPHIAADGSTIVEIYYDRGYYLMNFELGDGGYGTEPIYARYGASIEDVNIPTRAGYIFKGWSLDGTTIVGIPETMPARSITYKAVWDVDGTAKVTVVFWGENADDTEYSYIKSAEVRIMPGTEFTYDESGSLLCGVTEVHTHSVSCGYACGEEEHLHDMACYEMTCSQEVHTHNDTCRKCGFENHTHTTSCYNDVGDEFSASISEHWVEGTKSNGSIGESYYTYLIGNRGTGKKYIYINGTWYKYSGSSSIGSTASTTCGKKEGTHTHTAECLKCTKSEHTHTDYKGSCYSLICTTMVHTHNDACGYNCGKTAHTHSASCYMDGAGLDSSLWTFDSSETVTVAADGSSIVNVKYNRTQKTLTFNYNYGNGKYKNTESITAKWGADISEQYIVIAANANSTFWSATSDGEDPYTNYFGVMPQTSKTYYNRGKTGSTGTMTYYGESLNGQYEEMFSVSGVGGYSVSDEDRYEFDGFTYHHGTSNGTSCKGAAFYYTRNSYNLVFNDGYDDVKTESVKYEAPLSTYSSFVPTVPKAYEPGSVEFDGWYLNPECTGAEYVLDNHTMPADNLLLYAKWTPTIHKVEFYLTQAGTKLTSIEVSHGSIISNVDDPENGDYTFVGWFYQEDGEEKAFDFENMPVKEDLKVYGKWSSNVLKEYTVLYKIQGTNTEVAKPTAGSALAGSTKTFEAKGGEDLYAGYQEGYFPLTQSHSILIDINEEEIVYTFWYVQKDAVPYLVKYVDENGNVLVSQKVVADNRKAVVTENFVPVSGWLPDAYQKRLVVTSDESTEWITVTVDGKTVEIHPDNVITFVYEKDEVRAYYKITHYTQNTDGSTWTEYASSEAIGDIGSTYTATPITINGFTFDSSIPETVVSGELTANGLELNLYYVRNNYPYLVRYWESGTGKQLAEPKSGTGIYGQVISETAIEIDNYDALDPASQTLNIRVEESSTAKLNIITFYYAEKEVTINYVVVGPEGCGTVAPTSETVKVLTGVVKGSTAEASSTAYRFVGWYKDAACTEELSKDALYVPAKDANDKNVKATYYAKFELGLVDLTIKKAGANTTLDKDQTFIFNVKGTDSNTSGINMTVVVTGNGSVKIKNLPVGSYEITEDENWSWRYTATENPKTVNLTKSETVEIENRRDNDKWIDTNDIISNIFNKLASN